MHDHRPIPAGITDGLILPTFHSSQPRPLQPQPQPQANLECPRCHSLDTKFCYFNNYNLAQPRHFCRSCRRYWTKGGVLRNVPVGGGCRKSSKRRPSSSSSSPSRPAKRSTPHRPPDDNREPSPSAVTPVPASWTVQEAGSIEAGVAGAVALRPPMFGYGSYEPSAPSPGVTDELRLPEELPGMAFADPIGWPGSLDVVVGWHDDAGGARSWTEGDPSRYLP